MSQFPPQQPMYQIPPASKPAGMAIASMVLGIISVVLFCVYYLSVPCAIVAIILGAIAMGKAKRGEGGGGGMAKAGVILGIINFVLIALLVALVIAGISMMGGKNGFMQKVQQMQQRQLQQMQQQQQSSPGTPMTMPAGPEQAK